MAWMTILRRRMMFWVAMLAVLVLSLMPVGVPVPTTGWDKTNHLLGFAVLALLGCWAYPRRTAAVLLGLLAYGGLIEILQFMTPHRYAEWADLLADGLGIVIGALVAELGRRTAPLLR